MNWTAPGDDVAVVVPAWLRHVAEADITAAEAAGVLCLGETARSFALYRRALDQAGCPRDRALLASELAQALADHGDRAEAITTAIDIALPVLEAGVNSAQCLDRLRHVAVAVGIVQGTLEIRERVDVLRQAILDVPAQSTEPATPQALASVPA